MSEAWGSIVGNFPEKLKLTFNLIYYETWCIMSEVSQFSMVNISFGAVTWEEKAYSENQWEERRKFFKFPSPYPRGQEAKKKNPVTSTSPKFTIHMEYQLGIKILSKGFLGVKALLYISRSTNSPYKNFAFEPSLANKIIHSFNLPSPGQVSPGYSRE